MPDPNPSPLPEDDFSYSDAPTSAPDDAATEPLFTSNDKRRPAGPGLSNPFWNK